MKLATVTRACCSETGSSFVGAVIGAQWPVNIRKFNNIVKSNPESEHMWSATVEVETQTSGIGYSLYSSAGEILVDGKSSKWQMQGILMVR